MEVEKQLGVTAAETHILISDLGFLYAQQLNAFPTLLPRLLQKQIIDVSDMLQHGSRKSN